MGVTDSVLCHVEKLGIQAFYDNVSCGPLSHAICLEIEKNAISTQTEAAKIEALKTIKLNQKINPKIVYKKAMDASVTKIITTRLSIEDSSPKIKIKLIKNLSDRFKNQDFINTKLLNQFDSSLDEIALNYFQRGEILDKTEELIKHYEKFKTEQVCNAQQVKNSPLNIFKGQTKDYLKDIEKKYKQKVAANHPAAKAVCKMVTYFAATLLGAAMGAGLGAVTGGFIGFFVGAGIGAVPSTFFGAISGAVVGTALGAKTEQEVDAGGELFNLYARHCTREGRAFKQIQKNVEQLELAPQPSSIYNKTLSIP